MPIPEALFSAHRPYSSAKVVGEKCFGPRVGQTRALVMPAIARLGRKSVIEPGIIVQRHPGVRAERIVDRLLRFGPDEMIRSAERRVGKECVMTCSSRWSPFH